MRPGNNLANKYHIGDPGFSSMLLDIDERKA